MLFLKTSEKSVEKLIIKILKNLFSAPGLAWKTTLKETEVKLELLTDIDMVLMIKKELEEEYVTQIIDRQKLIINI